MSESEVFGLHRLSADRVRGEDPPHPCGRLIHVLPGLIKAEVRFAVLSVVRDRSARLVALLAAATVGLMAWQEGGFDPAADRHQTGWAILSVVSVVWFSRILAPGGALEAARIVGTRWWVVPTGRGLGVVVLLVPVAFAAVATLASNGADAPGVVQFVIGGLTLAVTLGFLSMALTPFIGSSAAASVGFVLALMGGIPPVSFDMVFSGGWFQWVSTWVWTALPLQWRAELWLSGQGSFFAVSAVWLVLSLGAGAAAIHWRGIVGWWR